MTARSGELERVVMLASHFGAAGPGVSLGIGDDAAVIEPPPGPLVWTIDAQVEGTHFRLDWLTWEDVGWRSFMAAASDLAAMGAVPIAALSALALADDVDDAALDALARGQARAAAAVGAPVIGGNLVRGRETSVTTTVLGRAERPILRSGARPGDLLLVAGAVGIAAAGLAALQQGITGVALAPGLAAWRAPRALVEQGRAMAPVASAAIDVSDGLARDALHVAEASGVAIVVDEVALRRHGGAGLAALARLVGRDPLDLILGGGEDYALLVASASPIDGFVQLGVVVEGPPRLELRASDGSSRVLEGRGFDHWGTRRP